jgi:tetratricopeptide (TPR) repeat protein
VSSLQDRLQRALGDTYRIERELGGGGMSRVFLAVEQSLNRHVVIKLLLPELTSEASTARFKRELELTALLQHPHILPVLATGTRDGLLFYVMPYVEGESLRHRLQREGPMPVADIVRVLSELAGALAYAHERGVVHRDIKPENILLSNGVAVLADFGIAGILAGPTSPGVSDPEVRITDAGMAMGTPGYMSPEQAAGDQQLDARSDLYALAVVGYEMLSGEPPFTGATPLAVLTAHLTATPRPIAELRPDTPPALAAALARALAKQPTERFQTAAEFRAALALPWAATRGRRRARWPYAVAALGLLVVLGAAMMLRRDPDAEALDPSLVAVAPFEVLDTDHQLWREGLVDILAANLDGAGPIRTVAPAVAVRKWKGRGDAASLTEFGREMRAAWAVTGQIVPVGADSVRLNALLVDVATGVMRRQIEVRDAADRLDRVADSLSLRVLREIGETVTLGATRRAPIGSSTPLAVKAYLQGEQHYRRSDWDSAAFYYRRATEADSNFAPALRHLSNAMGWKLAPDGGNAGHGYAYALRAGALNHGLAPRESLLVTGDSVFAALIMGGGGNTGSKLLPLGERMQLARRLFAVLQAGAQRFPDDPELWFKLGDARYHFWFYYPSVENLARARAAFDRSAELDSAFAPAYVHLLDIALRQQDPRGARKYVERYLALEPIDVHAANARLVRDLLDPGTNAAVRFDSVLRSIPPQAATTTFQSVLTWADSAETQVRMAQALVANSRTAGGQPFRVQSRQGLAIARAFRGRYREAMRDADTIQAWVFAEAAQLGVIPADSAQRMFARWAEADTLKGRVLPALGWWATRRDTSSLQLVAQRVAGGEMPMVPPSIVQGYLALARTDTAEAVRQFTVPDSVCLAGCQLWRLPLARIHAAQHRDSLAATLLDQEITISSGTRVVWMLERARVNERLGRADAAIEGRPRDAPLRGRGAHGARPAAGRCSAAHEGGGGTVGRNGAASCVRRAAWPALLRPRRTGHAAPACSTRHAAQVPSALPT